MAGGPPVAVLAGAGYGKTTLLVQWAHEDPRPTAWLQLSEVHNDPAVLIADLVAAARSVRPPGSRRSNQLADPAPRDIFAHVSRPFLLVLDDVHHVVDKTSLSVLRSLVETLPPESRLAFAARNEPALGLARLRANRELVELDSSDLAMTESEATSLLQQGGIVDDPLACERLVDRTEGWPAGLNLALLSVLGASDPTEAAMAFAGDDRNVVEYLRDEVVHPLPRRTVDFLVQTSVLDRLSGPLCDAVLGRAGSARLLDDLHDSNLLVAALDRNRQWYQCHTLFRDMLRSELRRRKPEVEADLHTMASSWFEASGDADAAVRHAHAAHDETRVDELVWRAGPHVLWSGRPQTLALLAGAVFADRNRGTTAARRDVRVARSLCRRLGRAPVLGVGRRARAGRRHAPRRRGAAVRSDAPARRARRGRNATDLPRRLARVPARPGGQSVPGDRVHSRGWCPAGTRRTRAARARLREGVVIGRTLAPAVEAQGLAQLAILAAEDGEWVEAAELSTEAMNVVDTYLLADQPAMAVVFGISALVHLRTGAMSVAVTEAKHAMSLSSMPRDVGAWVVAEVDLLVARTFLLLGDVTLARTLLHEAQGLLRRIPDVDSLLGKIEEALERAGGMRIPLGMIASPLTPAEMRVLQFLPTHLTFPAIADELFVSRNTVKSQAISIYRKLGVTARMPAVEAARRLGFLEP